MDDKIIMLIMGLVKKLTKVTANSQYLFMDLCFMPGSNKTIHSSIFSF